MTNSRGFYDDPLATWGIDVSWITLGRRRVKVANGCQYSENVSECQDEQNSYFYDFPLATKIQICGGSSEVTIRACRTDLHRNKIYNPKKLIQDTFPTASELLDRFKLVASLSSSDEIAQLTNLVDATSVPTFTLQQAVESMQNITKKADDIKKEEKEQFILNFLSSVLFIIPIAGEAAGAADLIAVSNLL
ncbi:hypothetical protein G6514_005416 [Epicoccum nigrum]|nr:hypothetical protein G6514_005416 [Epicoccum nigrum]